MNSLPRGRGRRCRARVARRVGIMVLVAFVAFTGACALPSARVTYRLPSTAAIYPSVPVSWDVSVWDGHRTARQRVEPDAAGDAIVLAHESAMVVIGAHGWAALPDGREIALGWAGGWLRAARFGGPLAPDLAIELSFEHGATARVLLDCALAGLDPALVNAERLDALVRRRSGARPDLLDHAGLVSALAGGTMASYAVTMLDGVESCVIELPPDRGGSWYASTPLMPRRLASEPVADRPVVHLEVARGERIDLWQIGETGSWATLSVAVGAHGHVTRLLRRGESAAIP